MNQKLSIKIKVTSDEQALTLAVLRWPFSLEGEDTLVEGAPRVVLERGVGIGGGRSVGRLREGGRERGAEEDGEEEKGMRMRSSCSIAPGGEKGWDQSGIYISKIIS